MVNIHTEKLEKQEQTNSKSKATGGKKIRAEMNEMNMWKSIQKINKIKSWFFKSINTINRLLDCLIKKRENSNKHSQKWQMGH